MAASVQALVEILVGSDVDGFLGIMKSVLSQRGDFVQPLTTLLVPNIIYPPSAILEERRCVGIVSKIFPEKKYGFISCPTIFEEFHKDCIVLGRQLRDFPIGSKVNFAVCLEKDGRPQAYDLHEVRSMCIHFVNGSCKDGAGCLFSHDLENAQLPQQAQVAQAQQAQLAIQASGQSGSVHCPWFSKGFCKNGDGCPYVHDATLVTGATEGKLSTPCKFFAQGCCQRGDACKFTHVPGPDMGQMQMGMGQPGLAVTGLKRGFSEAMSTGAAGAAGAFDMNHF